MRPHRALVTSGRFVLALAGLVGSSEAYAPNYESPHVHPIDATSTRVLVINTPDARLSIFDVVGDDLVLADEVRVGMEPITVRALDDQTAWVVNHLSDDVTVVDLATGSVVATIATGDEPADVAFVPDPTSAGETWAVISVSQEDRVLVVEADAPFTEVASLDIRGSDPRALVVDGTRVWVAVFESGNKTTIIQRALKESGPWSHLDPPLPPIVPPLNPDLPDSLLPDNSVIVRKSGGDWLDEQGGNWNSVVTWDTSDADLVAIDCSVSPPAIGATVSGVGTLLYDVVRDPDTGDLWVMNTEAHNEIYFESKLTGNAVRNHITRVNPTTLATTVYSLNTHVDVGAPGSPTPPSAPALRLDSIALPNDAVVSDAAGADELYVTGMGGTRVAVVDPGTGTVSRRLPVSRGASGIARVPGSTRLVVVNRFDHALELVDPMTGLVGSAAIGRSAFDPTAPQVKVGREHLYSAEHSAHGTFSCASCHAHGNFDQLAWDLGDPTGELVQLDPEDNGGEEIAPFHPLKGPMMTQTLRGLADLGLLHWRGDRLDFTAFNPAFASLLGGTELSSTEMLAFEEFGLSIEYPPNPLIGLDDSPPSVVMDGSPSVGRVLFDTENDGFCVDCHAHPRGTTGFAAPIDTVDGLGNQPMKIAQLRNLYEKIGFESLTAQDNKLGFGYFHDGSDHDLADFLLFFLGFYTAPQLVDIQAFLLTFPTGTHGGTGHHFAVDETNRFDSDILDRYTTLEAEADAARLDLIATTRTAEGPRGFYRSTGSYQSDRIGEEWTFTDLSDLAGTGTTVSFMAVPVGQGIRMAIDRDEDGYYDRTELDFGSDPADPSSVPTLDVDEPFSSLLPGLSRITRAFPVPFHTRVSVNAYVGESGWTDVSVFDVGGRRVRRLVGGHREAGRLDVQWDGRDDAGREVAAGTYILGLRTASAVHARKIIRVN